MRKEEGGPTGPVSDAELKLRMAAALARIVALDPEKDSPEGRNEWGEADCFNKAQDIAREGLGMPPMDAVDTALALGNGDCR